jgi:mannosyl-3-phosphoglycerate phosphatase family protein
MDYVDTVHPAVGRDTGTAGQIVIFTDLDGTLLDAKTYSFAEAKAALRLIEKRNIPLVICSSKTRVEIEHYRFLLGNTDPFVSENGGGIFIPKEYAALAGCIEKARAEELESYLLIRLGSPYKELRHGLRALQEQGFPVRGFGDMTVEEVSQITGLPLHDASMAMQREFDEPFIFGDSEDRLDALFLSILELGFHVTQGAFFHLLGNSDKGRAVSVLANFYAAVFPGLSTIGIGDSPNDIPMLKNVDIPVVVRKPDGDYDSRVDVPRLVGARGIGPKGWNEAVRILIQTASQRRQDATPPL